ncbi:calmodulin-lysine N-methyltransferase isoform X2 [Phymastichus coffea]|uniref:calmodulin-lysine N-methyltransferase isoform X2 n=1 Tax=Phymastichus coffea TaxID=108790 RepID=UPI00273C0557|nr:calmodulin-lysine N-methyltransferase isoform X2 [Phymastichus coffea]
MLHEQPRLLAQKRWRLLARALTGSPEPGPGRISTRRFGSFGLLRADHLPDYRFGQEAHCSWWLYSCLIGGRLYQLLVRRVSNCFTADQLIGFNNTGNNGEICRGRRVLELGGGMSCLAGALVAKYCQASSVTLTDGNARSVDNVARIVESNGLEGLARCLVVQWASAAEALGRSPSRRPQELASGSGSGSDVRSGDERPYDLILCADCLFFDEDWLDLVDTIYAWLADDGLALVMAPRRGATFRRFAEAAACRGLLLRRQRECYDPEIWARHLQLLASDPLYCPDIHLPVLLELTKPGRGPRLG